MASGETFGTDSGVGSTIALLEARLPAARERRGRLEEELAAAVAEESAIAGVLDGLRALSGTSVDGRARSRDVGRAQESAPVGSGEATGSSAGSGGPRRSPAPGRRATAVDASPVASPVASPSSIEAAAKPARKTTGRSAAAKKAGAGRQAVAAKSAAPEPKQGADQAPAATAREAVRRTARKGAPKATPRATGPRAAKKAAPEKPVAVEVQAPLASAAASGRRRLTDADGVLAVLSQAPGSLRAREVTVLLGLEALDANINAIRTRLERLAKDGRAQRSGRGLYTVAAGRPGAAS